MIQYVDTFKDRFGVEATCRTLGATECGFLTARGYRAAKTRPASARALRDELLGAEIKMARPDPLCVSCTAGLRPAGRVGIARSARARLVNRLCPAVAE